MTKRPKRPKPLPLPVPPPAPKALRQYRGRRPPDHEIEKMRGLGYLLPGDAAKATLSAKTTVYGWITRKLLKSPTGDNRPPVFKSSTSNIWILEAALVSVRPPLPKSITEPGT